MKTIFFDLDGTLVDFYSVENWLPMLIDEKTHPYEVAKPMLNMSAFARKLNKIQSNGVKIGIISWGSKGATAEFQKRICDAKTKWLKKHLPSVKWDYVFITYYGHPKYEIARTFDENAILFDDEEGNRLTWDGIAYDEKNIMKMLEEI